MKIERPDANRLLLTQRRHYVLLAIGAAALGAALYAVFLHGEGAWTGVLFALLWLGFSSGHGTMLLDRGTRTVTARKRFFGIPSTRIVPFSDIRYAEAALVRQNRYFRLVLRGGRTLSLVNSANLLSNAEQVADAVNEFLGLYNGRNFIPPAG